MIFNFKTIAHSQTAGYINIESSNKQKGDAFEHYVIDHFDKRYFKLLEWRSDKIHNGTYTQSSMLPDWVYQFRAAGAIFDFAVECKWRRSFIDGRIEWAKEYQLNRNFSAEKTSGCL